MTSGGQHSHGDEPIDPPDAMVIYQAHLDRLSRANLAGDWATIAPYYAWPNTILSRDKTMILNSESEGEAMFLQATKTALDAGTTDMVRIAKEAHFVAPDHIDGIHTVHILRRALHLVPPYETTMTLRLIEGLWKKTVSSMGIYTPNNADTLPEVRD